MRWYYLVQKRYYWKAESWLGVRLERPSVIELEGSGEKPFFIDWRKGIQES